MGDSHCQCTLYYRVWAGLLRSRQNHGIRDAAVSILVGIVKLFRCAADADSCLDTETPFMPLDPILPERRLLCDVAESPERRMPFFSGLSRPHHISLKYIYLRRQIFPARKIHLSSADTPPLASIIGWSRAYRTSGGVSGYGNSSAVPT